MAHYAYIAVILALLAFITWYTDKADEGGYNRCVASYEAALRTELNESIASNAQLQEENNQLVLDLLNQQPEIRTVYQTIEKEVEVYVPINPTCNLTRGAVRLRNRAGDPEQLRTDYHPGLSEAEARSPSTITQREGERQTHEWGELYYELSTRYMTLLGVCENNNKNSSKRQ